jgi:ubiquinone/menaquinone biosynthesis C-methylase UbiE
MKNKLNNSYDNKGIVFEGKDLEVQQDWDIYWTDQNQTSGKLYDFFADFYRNNIIKKALNHFLLKHFTKGQELLHAGCGSGKVDTDIVDNFQVTALDISLPALKIYDAVNQHKAKIVQASIFEMPFEDETFDGIYDLGVIEHFTEDEIQQILMEFKRVLKKNGKICLFIPPTYGLTVKVLDTAHFILNKILRKNRKLHPDEITRVRSKAHIKTIIEKAGFSFIEYYFGPKDLFTQIVIVGEKK